MGIIASGVNFLFNRPVQNLRIKPSFKIGKYAMFLVGLVL